MYRLVVIALFLCVAATSVSAQDIVVTSHTGPTTLSVDEQFTATIAVKNTGVVAASSSGYVVAVLSTNNSFESSDLIAGYFTYDALSAGASAVAKPENVGRLRATPGTYYLILVADYFKRVTETDETNNALVIPNFVVTPSNIDLAVQSVTTDNSSYTQSSRALLSCSVKNVGTTPVGGGLYISYALSKDAVASDDDLEIDVDHNYFNTAGTTVTFSDAYNLPNVPPGDYYILAFLSDRYNSDLTESNKSNNIASVPITITTSNVDLTPFYFSYNFRQETGGGSTLDINYILQNLGTDGVGGASITVTLQQQFGLGEFSYTSYNPLQKNYIPAGDQAHGYDYFYIYEDLPPGSYDVTISIGNVAETDYENNNWTSYTPLVISPPAIAATQLLDVRVAGPIDNADQQVVVELLIDNRGDLIPSFQQGYDISITNAAHELVYSTSKYVEIDFPHGVASKRTVNVALPSTLPAGTYTISAMCFGLGCSSYDPVSSTFAVTPAQYTVTGTIRGEDGPAITKGKLFLYQDNGSGNVRFVQKIDPLSGSTFSFPVNSARHTLYFIPDRFEYPDYVPTVYGKTVTLSEQNFFHANADMNIVFEVVKVKPLGTGTGVINGYVSSGTPVGRSGAGQVTLSSTNDIPVVLLSAAGEVVGITYTDENGFYEFKNLPRDEYQVMLSVALDDALVTAPVTVDVTTNNVRQNLSASPSGITPEPSQLYLSQAIRFEEFSKQTYGATPIALDAESDAGLPIVYETSNANVATIVDGKVFIRNAGSVEITAKQAGDNFYLPATERRTLNVDKASQSIVFEPLSPLSTETGTFTLSATASSGLAVTFESSDESILSIDGNTVTIHGSGTAQITARQDGNQNYLAANNVVREQAVGVVMGLEDPALANKVFPNPTTGIVTLQINRLTHVEVYDVTGRIRRDVVQLGDTLDFSLAESGVYLVKVSTPDRTATTRIVRK